MVYCGKPSTSCFKCKERRIKCDRRKPDCGQCVRAHLECPGYRNPLDLVFKDESKVVRQKALDREAAKLKQSIVTLSVEDRAKYSFYSQYVYGNSRSFDYLESFYPCTEKDEQLSTAISAVSLAHLAGTSHCSRLVEQARQKYVTALRLTNTALQSSDLATRDTTLLTVLLLDLFEKLTKKSQHIQSWTDHINGAVKLVKLRGSKQFHTTIGCRMFLQLCSNIMIHCMQHGIDVPSDLVALRVYAAQFIDATDPKWRFTDVMIRFAKLRATIREQGVINSDMGLKAIEIESELYHLSESIPPERYSNRNWNILRLSRILLNDIIHQQCLDSLCFSLVPCSPDPLAQIELSTNKIIALSSEICSTVPDYVKIPGPSSRSKPASTSSDTIEPSSTTLTADNLAPSLPNFAATASVIEYSNNSCPVPKRIYNPTELSCCYSLIFPLYIAARSVVIPETRRRLIIEQLRFIGENMGIWQGNAVAGVLERWEDVNPWSVYATIGSYSFTAA